jgi:cysteine desulfurase
MQLFNHKPIYLDHQATTPVDDVVMTAMLPYFQEIFGNPASNHFYGWAATAAIEQARAQVAQVIGAQPTEIIFTSGATEANNLAIKGVAEAHWQQGRHIITLMTEHAAVLEPCGYLANLGFEITYLPVNPQGLVDPQKLAAAIRPDTILVSVMVANNEIGVIQPIPEIGAICRQQQVAFHTDAVQAIGYVDIDVADWGIDLLSLSAHKIYGPPGVGALYVRSNQALIAQQRGGNQEGGKRAGTLATPLIVGCGAAVALAAQLQATEVGRLTQLRDELWQQLQVLPDIQLNGDQQQRVCHNLNVSFAGIDTNILLSALQPLVALSAGSACSTGRPSHVLKALGRSPQQASLRFSLGRHTTATEIAQVATATIAAVQNLRS